jgi:predicted TIM-barrel fold metal-dependent hydrolase
MSANMLTDSPLAREFWEQGRAASCPIIDMHGHMGAWHSIYFPRPDPADMIRTMDECGVRLLVFSHHMALFAPDLGNRASIEAVRRFPDRLRAYCVINPNHPAQVEADIASFEAHRDVYVGFKFLSDYHRVPLSDPGYRLALDYADRRGLPVLMHTWAGSPFDGAGEIRKVAERHSDCRLLLGHSIHDDWHTAAALAREFPHLYLELTAVFDDCGALEVLCGEAGSDRLLFGTDLPWFDPHHAVGALLSAHITDEDRRNICHRNAERLLNL